MKIYLLLFLFLNKNLSEILDEENICLLNFSKSDYNIELLKLNKKMVIKKNKEKINWEYNDEIIIEKRLDENLIINSEIETDYINIEGEIKNTWILLIFEDFNKFDYEENNKKYINFEKINFKVCSNIPKMMFITTDGKIKISLKDFLSEFKNEEFSFRLDLQFNILGNWKENDLVNVFQGSDLIYTKNFQICGKEIFKNSCFEKGIDICDTGYPSLVNQKIYIDGEFNENFDTNDFNFEIKLSSENLNDIEFALTFFQLYIKFN